MRHSSNETQSCILVIAVCAESYHQNCLYDVSYLFDAVLFGLSDELILTYKEVKQANKSLEASIL